MPVIAAPELSRTRVRRWKVEDGRLLVEMPRGQAEVRCTCGCTHLLPTEELGRHMLLLRCHRCRTACEVPLAGAGF